MTEVRGGERSCLHTGGAADGQSDAPVDMAMKLAMAVTSIAAGTADKDTVGPMERNENGMRSRTNEVPATTWALRDLRRHMERAAQQQARKLAQLHRTIAKIANTQETYTILQEAQWHGMKLWLEEKEQKGDAYHQDDVMWGKEITDMVARVVAATEHDQAEEREADTEGPGLEASIPADLTQKGRPEKPEEYQQLQPGRQPQSMPMPKPKPKMKKIQTPNPNPTPAPRPAPTLTPTPRATVASKWATTPAPTPTR
jgi:hypothetical protein